MTPFTFARPRWRPAEERRGLGELRKFIDGIPAVVIDRKKVMPVDSRDFNDIAENYAKMEDEVKQAVRALQAEEERRKAAEKAREAEERRRKEEMRLREAPMV